MSHSLSAAKSLSKFSIFFLILFWTAVNSSCSLVGRSPASKDSQIKSLQPSKNKALIYILYPDYFTNVKMYVYINGIYLGTVAKKRYVYALLKSANYHIEVDAEKTCELYLKAESGKTYFILIEPQMGAIYPRCGLKQINGQQGEKLLSDCFLSSEIHEEW